MSQPARSPSANGRPLRLDSRRLRLVGYVRKSDQDDGVSVAQQIEWLQQIAREEGFELVAVFCDQAKRGWDTGAREDFHKMLEFCQAEILAGRPIDGVACWAPNRFSRADSQETDWFIWEYRKLGADRMRTQTHGWLDFARPEQRIVFGIQQEFGAHAYVRDLSQDVLRGQLQVAQDGRRVGGRAPFGYVSVLQPAKRGTRQGSRLALADLATVQWAKWIFQRFLEAGVTRGSLCRELMTQGVPSPSGGKIWRSRVLEGILSNPAYLGRAVWNRQPQGRYGRVVGFKVELQERPGAGRRPRQPVNPAPQVIDRPAPHEAIIDPETFERVQAKLAAEKPGRPRQRHVYPLSGLLICGNCGKPLCGIGPTTPGRKPKRYYHCPRYQEGCHWNGIDAERLLRALVNRLQETAFAEANLRRALVQIHERCRQVAGAGPERMAQVEKQLEAVCGKLRQAETRFAREEDQRYWPALRERVRELDEQRNALELEQDALQRQNRGHFEELEGLAEEARVIGRQLLPLLREGRYQEVGELLQVAVEKVEVFFTHPPRTPVRPRPRTSSRTKKQSLFAKAEIHFREGFRELVQGIVPETLELTDLGNGALDKSIDYLPKTISLLPEHLDAANGTPPLDKPSNE